MSKIEQNTTALQELLEAVNNLPSGEGGGEVDPIELQSKTVTPTKSVQEVVADNGYDGLEKVTVNAIPSEYITTSDADATASDMLSPKTAYVNGIKIKGNIPTKTSNDLRASGSRITVPSGYYANIAEKSVATASQAIPTISVNSSGQITVSATQTAGYVSAGTVSKTKQLTTKGATTITPSKSSQTAVESETYTTGAITVAAIPAEYIIPSGTLEVTENGIYDVMGKESVTVNVASGGGGNGILKKMIANIESYSISAADLIGITCIRNYAFYECRGLTSIVIPEGVTSIGAQAFYSCVYLTSIVIPEGVTSIGQQAFLSCNRLTSVVIPKSVTSMGGAMFQFCYELTSVKMKATTPPTISSSSNMFASCNALTQIIVPAGCGNAYRAATNWSNYANIIIEEES